MKNLLKKLAAVLPKAIPAAAVFVLSALLAGGEFVYGICPFSASMLCAAPTVPLLCAAFAGAMLRSTALPWGTVMYMMIYTALFAMRAGVLLVTSSEGGDRRGVLIPRAHRGTRSILIGSVIPAAAAAAAAGVAISAAERSVTVYSAVCTAVAAAAAGGGAFLFTYLFPAGAVRYPASDPAGHTEYPEMNDGSASLPDFRRRTAALMLMIYAVLSSLRGITLFSMSLSTVFAFAASLLMSRLYGAGGGVLAATAAGIAVGGAYAPVFALAAAVNGFLCRRRSAGVRISAALTAALGWAVLDRGLEAVSDILPEAVIVAAAAIPLSQFFLNGQLTGANCLSAGANCPGGKDGESGQDAPAAYDDAPHISPLLCRVAAYIGMPSGGVPRREIKTELDCIRLEDASGRLRSLSGALQAVGEGLTKMSKRMDRPMKWECRRLCEAVMSENCPACAHTGLCWNREYSSTNALSSRFAAALVKKGSVDASDFPEYLLSRCPRAESIAGEINCRYRSLWEKCGEENPASPDFALVSELIDDVVEYTKEDGELCREKSRLLRDALEEAGLTAGCVSVYGSRLIRVFIDDIRLPGTMLGERDIREVCARAVGRPMRDIRFSIDGDRVSAYTESAPMLGAVWGRAGAPGGREVSGDTISVFSGEGDRLVALLSDGMGSGEEAALMSGMGAVVMKRLLKAGASPAAALKLLNRVLCTDRFECTVTMDILEVDRLSGKCSVTKSGAAPSFVVRDGRLFRLSGETLPLGILSSPDSSFSTFDGRPGDTIVMVSDGIDADSGECPWLADLLSDPGYASMSEEELAGVILKKSRMGNTGGPRDDATALVVRLKAA